MENRSQLLMKFSQLTIQLSEYEKDNFKCMLHACYFSCDTQEIFIFYELKQLALATPTSIDPLIRI